MNKFMQMLLEAVGRTSNGIEEHYELLKTIVSPIAKRHGWASPNPIPNFLIKAA